MVDVDHPRLSMVRQCKLVSISRSSHYYTPKGESPLNVQMMRLIDEQYLLTPWYGARQMARYLRRQGHDARRKRIGRLMRRMGLSAIYRKPQTSRAHPAHKIYPYLLSDLQIDRPNHAWCADIERREALLYRAVMKEHRHPARRSGVMKLRAARSQGHG